MPAKQIVWFDEVEKEDVALVGGKGANLGEMTRAGFPVPSGFIVTATAYFAFLQENGLREKINTLITNINYDKPASLTNTSKKIKALILSGTISEKLTKDIFHAYKRLSGIFHDALVAVRSSATAEDLPDASFAGQQETYLNVKGEANLLLKIKEAWASLFDARALFYRHEQHYDHFRVGIAIPVQKMVESEKSGIMFTIDPVTNDKSKIVIEAIYGLGELIVQGAVTPDHYEVLKPTMEIIAKQFATQKIKLIKKGHENKEIRIPERIGKGQKITDKEILALAELGRQLEKHYYFPQDSEWAIEKGHIYLVQTRPVTTIGKIQEKRQHGQKIEPCDLTRDILVHGDPASPGMATGPVKILQSAKEINRIVKGDVLVAPQTNPDFVPAMKKAVAIVTDMGGRTSHAAIVSREIGIPAVVGTQKATKVLTNNTIVTVNGTKGEVYKGSHIANTPAAHIPTFTPTATKVYVNVAEPEFAQTIACRHVDGVGLLRAEFMMAGIGTHPRKLIKEKKQKVFIEKLAQGLETFASSFNPRPVVYRSSDFKTNEYRNLVGGKEFEPEEPNPMLGFRGATRYIADPEVFELELKAISYVRNKKGYKNLWLMIPFVRTVQELEEVKKIIAASGLYRSPSFKLWMMVEIPSNVILLDDFIAAGIDGISIGSNDLTMLLLGTDRDNAGVAHTFDEENPAVLWALEKVIKTAHAHRITSSLCGQAASQSPKLLEKLVQWGVTSVSVSPDVIETTRKLISQTERKLIT